MYIRIYSLHYRQPQGRLGGPCALWRPPVVGARFLLLSGMARTPAKGSRLVVGPGNQTNVIMIVLVFVRAHAISMNIDRCLPDNTKSLLLSSPRPRRPLLPRNPFYPPQGEASPPQQGRIIFCRGKTSLARGPRGRGPGGGAPGGPTAMPVSDSAPGRRQSWRAVPERDRYRTGPESLNQVCRSRCFFE